MGIFGTPPIRVTTNQRRWWFTRWFRVIERHMAPDRIGYSLVGQDTVDEHGRLGRVIGATRYTILVEYSMSLIRYRWGLWLLSFRKPKKYVHPDDLGSEAMIIWGLALCLYIVALFAIPMILNGK